MATREAVSKSMTSFWAAITPIIISFLMTSETVTFSREASSETVISSGISTLSCCFRARSRARRWSFSASVSR